MNYLPFNENPLNRDYDIWLSCKNREDPLVLRPILSNGLPLLQHETTLLHNEIMLLGNVLLLNYSRTKSLNIQGSIFNYFYSLAKEYLAYLNGKPLMISALIFKH